MIVVSPEAEADLEAIRAWYEQQRSGLGAEFLLRVEGTFQRMERQPEAPALIHKDMRRVRTPKFPYSIYYRIIDGEIVVVGVFHSRRDPRAWQARV